VDAFEIVLGLLVIVAALVTVARKIQVPYPILLVLGGLALALVPNLPRVELEPNLVFVLFLPPLLYSAAFRVSLRDFQANLRPISLLAIGLVFFTMLVVAIVAHQAIGMAWAPAFVLGIVVSPPDAVAAIAIAEQLRVPRRVVTILEGEGLMNDAVAFVTYRVAVAAVVTGVFSLQDASIRLVLSTAGGVLTGLVAGYVSVWVRQRLDDQDQAVQITIGLLTPFAAYIVSEASGVSGIVAVVVAGLYAGRRSPDPRFMTANTRLQSVAFWEMIVFILNGLAFILIGLQLPVIVAQLSNRPLLDLIAYALLISATIIVVRLVWVFPAAYLPRALSRRLRERDPYPPWQQVAVVGWAGMRGIDSLAAVLALPLVTSQESPFPDRDLILFLTFCAIFATLVLQGLSLAPLIRWLKLSEDGGPDQEEAKARLKSTRAGSARLEQLATEGQLPEEMLDDFRGHYAERIRRHSSALDGAKDGERERAEQQSDVYQRVQRELVAAERQELIRLRNQGVINDEVLRRVQRELDLEESLLGE
jgi:Na+/H+ antiporter